MHGTFAMLARVQGLFVCLGSGAPFVPGACPEAAEVASYPSDPVTLRQLCIDSPRIVVAEVGSERWVEESIEDGWAEVELRIHRVLKGTAPGLVTVRYPKMRICPMPPRFERGHRAIVFLGEDAVAEDWVRAVLDDAATRDHMVLAIEAWEDLRSRELPDAERRLAEVEWMVALAEDPLTRWDGAVDLLPPDRRRGFADPEDPIDRRELLQPEQWDRLVCALEESPAEWDHATVHLAEVLRDSPDPRVRRRLLRFLREAMGAPRFPEACVAVMQLLVEGPGEAADRIRQFEALAKDGDAPRRFRLGLEADPLARMRESMSGFLARVDR